MSFIGTTAELAIQRDDTHSVDNIMYILLEMFASKCCCSLNACHKTVSLSTGNLTGWGMIVSLN